jgi:uncharacterized protein (TIGR02145 family)
MKRIFTICAALLTTASVFLPQQTSAQAPEKMSYQAVVRDGSNNLVSSRAVGIKISILQGSSSGTTVYVETQTPTSNSNGLVSLEIGAGTVVSGIFATINWANGPYFIKTETDPTGGTSYSITGTNQLLSVPYALHAKTAEYLANGTTPGEMQYWDGSAWVAVAPTSNDGATLQMIGGIPTWTGGTPPPPNVTNPTTNKIWMDRNLGASRVATSSTDTDAYGDLYQWGRGTDGHQIRTSGTTSTLSSSDNPGHGNFIINSSSDWRNPQNDNLWQGVSGTNNPCPSGYRLPTEAEWVAERASWSNHGAAGALASPLKLTMAGERLRTDGSLFHVDHIGVYWSSSVSGTSSHILFFNSVLSYMNTSNRASGYSVRCLKD